MSEAPPLLRIRHATVLRGRGRPILDDVSLDIAEGQHTAILGPNGSGKSSLVKLITQEYRPLAREDADAGVEIFGRYQWDVIELRRLMGIVSPDLHDDLKSGAAGRALRGLETVVSGFFASRGVHPHQAATETMWARAREALAMVEADHLSEKPIPEMSTGEARRVLIARALVSDPPALLLDEPTAGLDIVAAHAFIDTLGRLAGYGKTIVLVTHHLHEILPEVNRVVLLRGGKVYRDGPKEDVLTEEHLSAAFGATLRVRLTDSGHYTVMPSRLPAGIAG